MTNAICNMYESCPIYESDLSWKLNSLKDRIMRSSDSMSVFFRQNELRKLPNIIVSRSAQLEYVHMQRIQFSTIKTQLIYSPKPISSHLDLWYTADWSWFHNLIFRRIYTISWNVAVLIKFTCEFGRQSSQRNTA